MTEKHCDTRSRSSSAGLSAGAAITMCTERGIRCSAHTWASKRTRMSRLLRSSAVMRTRKYGSFLSNFVPFEAVVTAGEISPGSGWPYILGSLSYKPGDLIGGGGACLPFIPATMDAGWGDCGALPHGDSWSAPFADDANGFGSVRGSNMAFRRRRATRQGCAALKRTRNILRPSRPLHAAELTKSAHSVHVLKGSTCACVALSFIVRPQKTESAEVNTA